jgi:hypothetical protein
VFPNGDEVELGSRKERPMTRCFPRVVEAVRANLSARCVVDAEGNKIVVDFLTRAGSDGRADPPHAQAHGQSRLGRGGALCGWPTGAPWQGQTLVGATAPTCDKCLTCAKGAATLLVHGGGGGWTRRRA